MKRISIFSLFMAICVLFYSKPGYSFSDEIKDALDKTLKQTMTQHNIPGAVVGIWIPDEGEWVKAAGFADKSTQEEITTDHHFRIGSVTKTFTVTALLRLVDEGKLSLDDKISTYVANVPNGDEITLRQLANMTSGLLDYTSNDDWKEAFFREPYRY